MAPLAQPKGVPILVDAAAEILTVPNVHLQNGATLVGYSGGKCLRGPQTAGLLLGRKDLVQAAWVHSAPHHGFARAMKVGKEEAIGMLDRRRNVDEARPRRRMEAVERLARPHRARGSRTIPGVTTEVTQPAGLSNKTPSLQIRWDRERLRLPATSSRTLLDGEPRITLFPRGARPETATRR